MNEQRIHFESTKGIETRMPDRFLIQDEIWTSSICKKIYNKTWWHFYPLLLLSIIAYIVAQLATLALLFFVVGVLEDGEAMNQLLAVLFGVLGGMGCLIVHFLMVGLTFINLPDHSRYIYDYSYKVN